MLTVYQTASPEKGEKSMKVRYIIIINEDERPLRVEKDTESGVTSVLITASTPEEAWRMVQEVSR